MATIKTRTQDYRDLDLDFQPHPVTGDLLTKTGPDAVARAIRNLVFTNFYDRPFRSYIGSNAIKLLFENVSPLTANILEDHIRTVISNFEPRVDLLDVEVIAIPDENGYNAKIVFTVQNRPEPLQTTVFLQRIR